MKGILIERAGGIDVLQYKSDIPVPVPKEGEVLIKNDFIGVNYIDTLVFSNLPSPTSLQLLTELLPQKFPERTLPSTQAPNTRC
jgi:NADPH:quinone reductase-like Zn-dependent oxidoreductase